tara:strand:- start:673 stop:1137 length:465 start_codon:yes stop_codon:yes gene_type:complete
MIVEFRFHKQILYLLLLIFLFNCQFKDASNNHGILFLENRSNKLIVNKMNIHDVINIIGQPHSKSIDNKNEWIYIERVFTKGEYHKLGQNVLKTNNVLLLSFDKYGILKEKNLFDKNDINKIAFSDQSTKNNMTKESFISEMFTSLRSKMYRKK